MQFELPDRIDEFLETLSRLYASDGADLLREIVVNGEVRVEEQKDYDNWNGGTYGHALTLTLPEALFLKARDKQSRWQKQIRDDINKLNKARNEHMSEVFFEMELAEGDEWREASGVLHPRNAAPSVPNDALSRVWGQGDVRVFLSHKAEFKVETSWLKGALMSYGVSSFVAHEDIEPTEEWQREIEHALFSMDALVALLTEDYHESDWTDQEAGVAIGRDVPLIAIRLGRDPYGLMGKKQGVGGCSWEDTSGMASDTMDLLHKRLPDKSGLFEAALSVYSASTSRADSAWRVEHVLSKFETLRPDELQRVLEAYRANPQNRHSFDGMDQLKPLLEAWSDEAWEVRDNDLLPTREVGRQGDVPTF